MLPCKRPAMFLSLAVLLSTLTACTNAAKNLEQSLAADPRLENNPVVFGQTKGQQVTATTALPADFPQEIPIYPNAKLEEVKPVSDSANKVSTRWQSSDPSNLITSFYRSQFQDNNWQILQQPTDDVGSFEAKRNDLLVTVTIQPQSVTNSAPNQPQTATELQIDYIPNNIVTTNQPNSQSDNSQFIGPVPPNANLATPSTSQSNLLTSQTFNDLNKLPAQWQQHIQDLAKLGIFSTTPDTTKSNSTAISNQFNPSKIITRREYARWLVAANNVMYANNPAKQVRLASESTPSTFRDVLPQDPDFPAIQGLAEAGLIPSSLSGDATAVLFRPDAPLTREQLVLWKVPLDTRQALPAANLEAVKETWGFQDGGKIEPKALRAVLADFQNGEQANIRRVFGYTTLFQPKKPVTRAEAAVALWYFGTQGEGISATEAAKLQN
ncbi:S-layer homology domain-containing protein [Cronbergia sp. UHCC 0137]|uniref:S-layer homology domain-containing protein n=1 Tax=Cronbergia sp. UHCC 0137 TaxID=3110239 RepID=UPI002B20E282|nr:S-layer homology domain-containing protein [Cronbergia sp. UHCC 0137]MEA5620038.1 S-layer homology domain-containing protein [Cronbergia sp. UHCC 0137]